MTLRREPAEPDGHRRFYVKFTEKPTLGCEVLSGAADIARSFDLDLSPMLVVFIWHLRQIHDESDNGSPPSATFAPKRKLFVKVCLSHCGDTRNASMSGSSRATLDPS
jgi:hypothetical protein